MPETPSGSSYEEKPIRCPRLGGPVTFSYCKVENTGRPCSRALACWAVHFDVQAFFRKALTSEEFESCFSTTPAPKVATLIQLIDEARRRTEQEHTRHQHASEGESPRGSRVVPSRATVQHEHEIRHKMISRGLGPEVAEDFLHMVRLLRDKADAYIPLDTVATPDSSMILDPTGNPDEVRELQARGMRLLEKAAVIKLNGGRSTTMGGEVPKGILIAKNGRSYLDIIAGQIAGVRKQWGAAVPLLLMNSFFTHERTLEVIRDFSIPIGTFIQGQVPRLVEQTLIPLQTGTEQDWAPPGHGDVYRSLHRSGLLDKLLAEGRRWVFISNLDNLAAVLEPYILGLMEKESIEFLIEVTDRTDADRKGGTLVVRNGRLDLLEIAQVSPDQQDRFMDIGRFRVFNTNNVWVNLESLKETLAKGTLTLPVIQNRKTIAGITVIQLETAMGAAVDSFSTARGLRVGRDRFFPTKTVEDLFVLQSDACILDSMDRVQKNPLRPATLALRPKVTFAPDFCDSPLKMEPCFEDPASVSLVRAGSLEVKGKVYFERDVTIEGDVRIVAPENETVRITRGSVLRDQTYPED